MSVLPVLVHFFLRVRSDLEHVKLNPGRRTPHLARTHLVRPRRSLFSVINHHLVREIWHLTAPPHPSFLFFLNFLFFSFAFLVCEVKWQRQRQRKCSPMTLTFISSSPRILRAKVRFVYRIHLYETRPMSFFLLPALDGYQCPSQQRRVN